MDVRHRESIVTLPKRLPKEFREVEILVNNAGLSLGHNTVDELHMSDVQAMIDTNVMGIARQYAAPCEVTSRFLCRCSHFLCCIPSRNERARPCENHSHCSVAHLTCNYRLFPQGHLINMSSVAGHLANTKASGYNASKFAVRGFTTAARHDLVGTPIRVTSISPGITLEFVHLLTSSHHFAGVVETEFSVVRHKGDVARAGNLYKNLVPLKPEDVADQVIFAATRPEHVQVYRSAPGDTCSEVLLTDRRRGGILQQPVWISHRPPRALNGKGYGTHPTVRELRRFGYGKRVRRFWHGEQGGEEDFRISGAPP